MSENSNTSNTSNTSTTSNTSNISQYSNKDSDDLNTCEKLYIECTQKYNSNLNESSNCFILYSRCRKYLKV